MMGVGPAGLGRQLIIYIPYRNEAWVENRGQISQHPEFPVEITNTESSNVTFPRSFGKGQWSEHSLLAPGPVPCSLHYSLSSYLHPSSKFQRWSWYPRSGLIQACLDFSTFLLLVSEGQVVLRWEEDGTLCCFDNVCLGCWISLFSWISWLLFHLFDYCFLISLISS